MSDDESWSSSSFDSEDEMAGTSLQISYCQSWDIELIVFLDLEPQKVNSLLPRPDSPSSAGKPKVPNKIHDVLNPVVVLTGADGEDLGWNGHFALRIVNYIVVRVLRVFPDEEVSVDIITQEVDKLCSMIENLSATQTSTKAILLSRKGALYRKLGQIK